MKVFLLLLICLATLAYSQNTIPKHFLDCPYPKICASGLCVNFGRNCNFHCRENQICLPGSGKCVDR
ncbi:TIL domain-containing protein [Caenorhabditis elegans]|uniref:TIL domain-containing protein n=1 Tax=Caenorhabditis elegans TaxID=6239 RepID=D3DEM4_CAEEL|nr:TIL domain-containing protein [Caenorhabditis elegans]CBJ25110.1 TIL domain-containing protein [Caenorhabditis elegans]|eukprot:NP_001255898.1 Uncharacterized protein CELE_Y51H4A.936 [Caenorhabditis elegans]